MNNVNLPWALVFLGMLGGGVALAAGVAGPEAQQYGLSLVGAALAQLAPQPFRPS